MKKILAQYKTSNVYHIGHVFLSYGFDHIDGQPGAYFTVTKETDKGVV